MNNKETIHEFLSNETFEIGKPYEFSDTGGFENPALRLLIKYDVPKGTYETETLTGHRYTYDYIRKPDLSSETVKVVYDKYVDYAIEKYAVGIIDESYAIDKNKQISSESLRALANKQDEKPANIHKIYLPMVGRVLIFAHGCTDKELITFIDKEIGSKYATKQITKALRELKNATAIHVYLPKECLGIIHIKRKAKDDQLSSLVHESLHFTLAVANHMGLILSWHSEEFFTYFQTHIFKTCKQYL